MGSHKKSTLVVLAASVPGIRMQQCAGRVRFSAPISPRFAAWVSQHAYGIKDVLSIMLRVGPSDGKRRHEA